MLNNTTSKIRKRGRKDKATFYSSEENSKPGAKWLQEEISIKFFLESH